MAVAKRKPPEEVPPSKAEIGREVLKLVEVMHEQKRIGREVIFAGIEQAIQLASLRHFGVEEGVYVAIDRATGELTARYQDKELDPVTLGRIAAQSAKQVMFQKIREAESDTVFNEYAAKKGELVVGTVQRVDGGSAILSLGTSEALLPRSESIPGESYHVGERVKAVVFEVRRTGQRVKVVLSRAHPDFVRCLFEEEIPEVADRTIDIRAVAREAGYRSKVAVASIDSKVDCVGACVGVRGSRIKNVIEEINGERIDIVRWNDSLQVLIPNALQPAQIADVFTYPRLGRAIVLVNEDQLSLAIGRRGQNVRLASKLVGMDLEIMTHEELGESLERAERWFRQLPHVSEEQVQAMIEEGFLSYNELANFIDAAGLASFTGLSEEHADEVLIFAEEYADDMDRSAEEERRQAEEAAAQARADAEAADRAEAAGGPEGDPADGGDEADGPTAAAGHDPEADDRVLGEGEPGAEPPAADGTDADANSPAVAVSVEQPAGDDVPAVAQAELADGTGDAAEAAPESADGPAELPPAAGGNEGDRP